MDYEDEPVLDSYGNAIVKAAEVLSDSDDSDSGMTVDAYGNSISKKQLKLHKVTENMRAEAKARREAKAGLALASTEKKAALKAAKAAKVEDVTELTLESLSLKAESGANMTLKEKKTLKNLLKESAAGPSGEVIVKVSNKEKKRLQKEGEKKEREEFEIFFDPLANFSLTVTGSSNSQEEDGDDIRQKDVIFKGVSISAPAKPLIVNADVKLVAGKRYGIIGVS